MSYLCNLLAPGEDSELLAGARELLDAQVERQQASVSG
jgi:hypothetical protein